MTWLLSAWAKAKAGLIVAGLFIAGLLAVLAKVKSDGKREGRQEVEAKVRQDNAEAVKKRKEVETEVGSLGSQDVDQRMERWTRRP